MNLSRVYLLIAFALFGFVIYAGAYIGSLNLVLFSIPILIFSILMLYISSNKRHGSAVFVYGIIFSIFHFGAVIPVQLGVVPPESLELSLSRWYYQYSTEFAIQLVLISVYFFSFGAIVFSSFSKEIFPVKIPQYNLVFDRKLKIISLAIYLIGFLSWVIIFLFFFGFDILSVNYDKYQLLVNNIPFISWSYLLLGFGVVILTTTSDSFWRNISIYSFFLWSIPAFIIGLRGEVLFPLSVMFVLWVRNGNKISMRKILIYSMLILISASAVRQLRIEGFSLNGIQEVDFNPSATFIELGSTLRPVVEVINWKNQGDDFIYGASYWAPFERILSKVLPIIDRVDAELDDRLMNVLVDSRVGPIGFSPVAEAYRNFGVLGVAAFFFLLGAALFKMDASKPNLYNNAIIGVLLLALLMQVRNAFTPVPAQILFGFFLVFIAKSWSNFNQSWRSNVSFK